MIELGPFDVAWRAATHQLIVQHRAMGITCAETRAGIAFIASTLGAIGALAMRRAVMNAIPLILTQEAGAATPSADASDATGALPPDEKAKGLHTSGIVRQTSVVGVA